MGKTAWDLTREFLTIIDEIDRAIQKKSKNCLPDEDARLDAEITRLECRMFEIKNALLKQRV